MNASRPASSLLRRTGLTVSSLLSLLISHPVILSAQEAAPKPEVISLWNGNAPIGDGTFLAEDAEITIHRPSHPNGAADE